MGLGKCLAAFSQAVDSETQYQSKTDTEFYTTFSQGIAQCRHPSLLGDQNESVSIADGWQSQSWQT